MVANQHKEDDVISKLVSEAAALIEENPLPDTESNKTSVNEVQERMEAEVQALSKDEQEVELERLMNQVNRHVSDVDGVKILENHEDGIYLTVYGPKGDGKAVEVQTIVDDLAKRKAFDVDVALIEKVVTEAKGETIKIVDITQLTHEDGVVIVKVSPDKMTAYLQVIPPKGNGVAVDFETAMAALEAQMVTYGINEEQVQLALHLGETGETVVVAQGKPVVNGNDAVIEYKFDPNGLSVNPKELANGKVDFYNLNLIQNVAVGQVLAVKIPLTEGEPGTNVLGESISSKPGKDKHIKAGKNTELMDGGSTLIATEVGHVSLKSGSVVVSPVYEVNGDVNFTTGNIDFVGSVIIKGSVEEGFCVTAEGDVEVNGSVAAGHITSRGHITVKGGIVGKGKSRIIAEGNVFAKFVESSNIEAGGDVVVGEAIMHSHVSANKTVQVGGRKGVIVGGLVRAGDEIVAKMVGSNFATATALESGVSPELRNMYNQCNKAFDEAKANLDKTRKAFILLKEMEKAEGGLSTEKKALLVKVSRAQFQLMDAVQKLSEQQASLEEQLEAASHGSIKVSGIVHPGVSITIGNAKMHVQDDIQFAQFVKDAGEIRTLPCQ